MSDNLMQKAHDAPRCGARSKRTGRVVVRQRCGDLVSAGCMALAVAPQRESETGITDMAPAQRKWPRLGILLIR